MTAMIEPVLTPGEAATHTAGGSALLEQRDLRLVCLAQTHGSAYTGRAGTENQNARFRHEQATMPKQKTKRRTKAKQRRVPRRGPRRVPTRVPTRVPNA